MYLTDEESRKRVALMHRVTERSRERKELCLTCEVLVYHCHSGTVCVRVSRTSSNKTASLLSLSIHAISCTDAHLQCIQVAHASESTEGVASHGKIPLKDTAVQAYVRGGRYVNITEDDLSVGHDRTSHRIQSHHVTVRMCNITSYDAMRWCEMGWEGMAWDGMGRDGMRPGVPNGVYSTSKTHRNVMLVDLSRLFGSSLSLTFQDRSLTGKDGGRQDDGHQ